MFEFIDQWRRDRFARRIQQEIMRAGGPIDFVYDRGSFALKRPATVGNLANIYDACREASPAQQRQLIGNFVAAFAQQAGAEDPTWGDAQPRLTAVLRERAFFAFSAGGIWNLPNAAPLKQTPAQAPYSKWFVKALVLDFPTHVSIVNESQLTEWGISFADAFALGLERLQKYSTPKFTPVSGFFVGTWNDDYDSSRLLCPELFKDLPLTGAPVVTIPNRVTLLVAGAGDPAGLHSMLAKAEEICAQQPKPQNPSPLVLRDGAFVDFDVDVTSPVFAEVQRAVRMASLSTYTEQKQNLERAYQQAGKELFVASYTLTRDKAGNYQAYSVWTKDVPSLLPVADRVMLMDVSRPAAAQKIADVSWARLVSVLGNAMQDTGMFPPRYWVNTFPTDEQVRTLTE